MKKIVAIVGILCGIITVCAGMKLHSNDYGRWQETSTSFGADFYTYSYRATARAADNVYELTNAVREGFSYMLMAFGTFEVVYFSCQIADTVTRKESVTGDACQDNEETEKLIET